jgi:ribonuclease-3
LEKATAWLKKALDYEFANDDLLRRALTHRSASGHNNERLEFLGDSVLQLVVSEHVYREKGDAREGRLSRLRSSLVKDATLSEVATGLGIGEHLILGSGERKTGGHRRASILADAIEAIFGAVYLDAGFDAARDVIERAFGDRLVHLPGAGELRDPKSRLQEHLQARQMPLPAYELVNVSGKAHNQFFEVSCAIDDGNQPTTGSGTTRRDAEQEAAARMLERLDMTGD